MILVQNLCFPDKTICSVRELYFHETDAELVLDGWYNLLYLEKRKKYTETEGLVLRFKSKGYRALRVFIDRNAVAEHELDPQTFQDHEISLPYAEIIGKILYVSAVKDPSITERKLEGGFYARISPENKREVSICIDICTFRREAYVTRNLGVLKDAFFTDWQNGEDCPGRHFSIYVIDNGQTLSEYEPVQRIVSSCGGKIHIFPNRNSGGAGGFSRGMLEVMKAGTFTHVLLMDDDAVIDPESLVRVFGFLSSLKEEWKQITIGGAMLREDLPHLLLCFGELWKNGRILHSDLNLDLREYRNASSDLLTETGHEHDRYSGWWFCCYSMETVRENNMPIPLFLHHDDIEFGMRNLKQGIVFLNGVGVWHRSADVGFTGVNMYYDVRNNLIEYALREPDADLQTLCWYMIRTMVGPVLKFNYREAWFAYCGLLDFLKGPEWLYAQDPEELNNRIRKLIIPMKPVEEVLETSGLKKKESDALKEEIVSVKEAYAEGVEIFAQRKQEKATWKNYLTINGLLLPDDGTTALHLPSDSPYRLYRKKAVLLYDPGSGKAMLVKRNLRQILKIGGMLFKSLIAVRTELPKSMKAWQRGIGQITNREAWEKYLNR